MRSFYRFVLIVFIRKPLLSRLPGTLRPGDGQPFAVQVEVSKREAGAQPIVVLLKSTVSDLLEAEDTLQYPERVLYFGPHPRLTPVLRTL